MKKEDIVLMVIMLISSTCFYAQKFVTKTGNVKFEASASSMEEVAAENKSVSAVLESSTGDMAVLALMKGFRFKVALMEEHFNENYVESDKYPKATFKGKVEGFDAGKVTADAKTYTVTGDLTLHGKTKHVSAPAKISKSGNAIVVTGAFDVKPDDFAIEIPGVVSKKVADKVKINYSFSLSK